MILLLGACTPTPQRNVMAYWLGEQLGTNQARPVTRPLGAMEGDVLVDGKPVHGAVVLVAERDGTPHSAISDAQGHYQITGIPPGQYTPAAIAVGLEEMALSGLFGLPWLVTIESNHTSQAPTFHMRRHLAKPLPAPLAASVQLSQTAFYTTVTSFPTGSQADVYAFQFTYQGAIIDTLRLYLPHTLPSSHTMEEAREETTEETTELPLLFMVYPSPVDRWVSVSTGYAAQGYALLAISPIARRGLDVDAHAEDARVGLMLALEGALTPSNKKESIGTEAHSTIDLPTTHLPTIHLPMIRLSKSAVALGGSFSSAILHRLLRDVNGGNPDKTLQPIRAWVTVGGIANAFTGTADFYAGRLTIPPDYRYLIPALGLPNLYPLPFLRFSPVYTAAELPSTLIIHTDADLVIPIDQAYQLEASLGTANVPVQVFYYQDVSHYLQIGDDMTDAGRQMFEQVLEFIKRQ